MLTACSLLEIDEKRTVSAIIRYIRNKSTGHSSGVLIGLSGGIDSALLATLAFKALGRDDVHTTYLYDRDSEKRLALRARQMADWLGVDFDAQNIEPVLKSRGVYRHPYVQLTRLNP